MKVRLRHQRLAQEIAQSNLSQNRWALKLGLSKPHLSMLVNGKRAYPTARTRQKLLQGTGISFQELFSVEIPGAGSAHGFEPQAISDVAGSPVPSNSKGDSIVHILIQDIRFAFRTLLKRPSFAAVVVITLALGIGANTAIFSIVDALLRQPLPYENPDQVAFVLGWDTKRDQMTFNISLANFADYSEAAVFEESAAYHYWSVNLTGGDQAQRLQGYRVTSNILSLLGVDPLLGRGFSPRDGLPGAEPVVVLSHSLWRDSFGSRPEILGQVLRLNDVSHEVVGVMPPGFEFPQGNFKGDLWAPLPYTPELARSDRRASGSVVMVGRLKSDLVPQRLQAELQTISERLERDYPELYTGRGVRVFPMHEYLVSSLKPALLILTVAVGFVLLIACANVASLLLGRAITRHREIAVRTALGASRGRLIRLMATESALLSLMGGLIGTALAWQAVRLLRLSIPAFLKRVMPSLLNFSINADVLLFTLGLSLLTAMIFGLAPALRASDLNVQDALREGGRQSGGSGRLRMRRLLAVGQLALSMVLLVASGLLIRTFWNLQQQDPGFQPERVLAFDISLSQSKYPELEQRQAFYQETERRIAGLPGVSAVGAVNRLPFSTSNSATGLVVEGRPEPSPEDVPSGGFRVATSGYFEAMGIPLERGRNFTTQDKNDAPPVAILNRAMSDLLFPGEDPLGKRVRLGRLGSNSPWCAVVGVVGNVLHEDMREQPRPEVYLPYSQYSVLEMTVALSSNRSPDLLASDVRREMQAFAPAQPVYNLAPLREMVARSLFALSFPMQLMLVFAGVALVMATVGLYGVISYLVGQRPHEYGLRMALGARHTDILRMVMKQGLGLAFAGVGLGAVGSLAATRLLGSVLFGVSPADPLTIGLVAGLLGLVALAACFIPARRATRVDPQSALRCE